MKATTNANESLRRSGQVAKVRARDDNRLAQRDCHEQQAPLSHVLTVDRVIGRVRVADARQRESEPHPAIDQQGAAQPDHDPAIFIYQPAGNPQEPCQGAPDQNSLKHNAEGVLATHSEQR
jgi:hypothetical protein